MRKRAETLLASMARIEHFTLGRVWTDLRDEELLWRPAPVSWGICRRSECETRTPFGDGEWVADFDDDIARDAIFGGEIEPVTTIGWLLWHIASVPGRLAAVDVVGGTKTIASGWTSPYLTHHPVFSRAVDATDALRDGWYALRAAVEAADDEVLEVSTAAYTYAPEPFRDGLAVLGPPGPEAPAYTFVAGTLNEISHHGAQICTLRDLHHWTRAG